MTTVKRMNDKLVFDFPGFSKKETEAFADLIITEAAKPFVSKKRKQKSVKRKK